MFASELPKLISFNVRTTFDDEIARALVASKLAAQLEQLMFEAPGGEAAGTRTTGDAIGELLLANRARFPRLRELGLPHRCLSPAVRKSLAVFGEVHDASGEYRYENSVE